MWEPALPGVRPPKSSLRTPHPAGSKPRLAPSSAWLPHSPSRLPGSVLPHQPCHSRAPGSIDPRRAIIRTHLPCSVSQAWGGGRGGCFRDKTGGQVGDREHRYLLWLFPEFIPSPSPTPCTHWLSPEGHPPGCSTGCSPGKGDGPIPEKHLTTWIYLPPAPGSKQVAYVCLQDFIYSTQQPRETVILPSFADEETGSKDLITCPLLSLTAGRRQSQDRTLVGGPHTCPSLQV